MQIASLTRGNTEVLQLHGKFDCSARNVFLRAVRNVVRNHHTDEIEINLGKVSYLDSCACGMLLLLRDKADISGKSVVIANAAGHVKSVLDMMQFRKLFPMR